LTFKKISNNILIEIKTKGVIMYISAITILNIALNKERKSIELYETLSKKINNPIIKDLIEDEKKHIEIASKLFDKNSNNFIGDRFNNPYLDDDFLAYAFASEGPYDKIDINNLNENDLLDVALAKEKDSVVFYANLIETIGPDFPEEKKFIEELRDQEKKHILKIVELKKLIKK
jgi:rubrerythrin